MSNKIITIFIGLFGLIILGMFLFTYISKNNSTPEIPLSQTVTATTTYDITRVEATHFFIAGVHTIVGEISLPTPCDLLTTDSIVAESFPEQITFDFSVINTTDTCAQMITSQRFKVSATASKDASMAAVFMGKRVELNLVEAKPGETPEEFELFIKG